MLAGVWIVIDNFVIYQVEYKYLTKKMCVHQFVMDILHDLNLCKSYISSFNDTRTLEFKIECDCVFFHQMSECLHMCLMAQEQLIICHFFFLLWSMNQPAKFNMIHEMWCHFQYKHPHHRWIWANPTLNVCARHINWICFDLQNEFNIFIWHW